MKQKRSKKETLKKRLIFFSLIGFAGFIFGLVMPFLAGLMDGSKIELATVKEVLAFLSLIGFIVAVSLGLYWFLQAQKAEKAYHEVDMDQEEEVQDIYNRLYRKMESAVVAANLATIFVLYQVLSGFEVLFMTDMVNFTFPLLPYLYLIVVLIFQSQLIKLVGRVRNYRLSVFSTVSEIREYVNSYDEGERYASMEQSFITLFNLNQKVLPILYVVVLAISVISQTSQLTAYVVLAFVHIYINLSQYRMIVKYFK